MGMFDTVLVPCPACGEPSEFQSKGGDCTLTTYTLDEAPDDVLRDVNRHAPNHCTKCDTKFAVEITGLQQRRTLHARSVVWQPCGSLLRSVSSDPCEALADGTDGLCCYCREFKALCEQHDRDV